MSQYRFGGYGEGGASMLESAAATKQGTLSPSAELMRDGLHVLNMKLTVVHTPHTQYCNERGMGFMFVLM